MMNVGTLIYRVIVRGAEPMTKGEKIMKADGDFRVIATLLLFIVLLTALALGFAIGGAFS